MADHALLEAVSLRKKFPLHGRIPFRPAVYARAVWDISFKLLEGETYGLVGESGSGKTTTGRLISGLTPADGGQVLYQGRDLLSLSRRDWKPLRRDIQFVFQDPFSSLDPKEKAGDILEESLIIHRMGNPGERRKRVLRMLELVGLQQEHYFRYPHEFSGGQRQRLSLARALIINPKIIICDEPVSALDVSIQSQILNILKRLQRDMHLTLLFISHDIRVVRHISSRVGVMYLGTLVEEASADALFAAPLHPYTQALFSAIPDFSRKRLKDRLILQGEIPVFTDSFRGCVFHTRCPRAVALCREQVPPRQDLGEDHAVLCHFP